MILGMDIGGTNIRSGFVDPSQVLAHFSIESSGAIMGQNGPEKLAQYIKELIDAKGITPEAVSVGFPSALDKSRRVLLSTPNVEGFDNVPIVDVLEKALGLPVYANRDVNMLYYHDRSLFHLEQENVVIGCYIGTGVGNVVAISGEPLIGRNGVAAELGHIPMLDMPAKCPCGNVGCIEMYGSGKHLREIHDNYYQDTPMDDLFVHHHSTEVLQTFIDYVAIAIATEINILDPDYVILGGGVINMKGFPRKDLEGRILTRARKPYPAGNLRFLYADNGQENGVIGAGIYGYEQMKKGNGK